MRIVILFILFYLNIAQLHTILQPEREALILDRGRSEKWPP